MRGILTTGPEPHFGHLLATEMGLESTFYRQAERPPVCNVKGVMLERHVYQDSRGRCLRCGEGVKP